MANISNIKIIVEDRFELEYESPETLGITFNRTVEDFTDLSKRFGEFSYTFALPKTKGNVLAFEFANVKGRRGIFVGIQKTCKVFNNDKLILNGLIELREINSDTFNCAFFSTFTQLIDSLRNKNLKDINSDIIGVWNDFSYETDIIAHLNANYKNSDETTIQFPLVNYSTPWTPYSVLDGASNDYQGSPFNDPENFRQNWYYQFSSDNGSGTNKYFFHQFPMAIYIVKILEGLLDDIGWSLGGSFFNRDDIKQIVMLYTGDNDVYDQAIGCSDDMLNQCTGVTDNLSIRSFLPEMSQTDFVKGLLNMFNLYFTLDTDNKIIRFETWNTMFGDVYDPYDITEKIFSNTINFKRIDNYDPSISFSKNNNERVLGDNKVMSENEDLAHLVSYDETEEEFTRQVFNRIGTTSEINIPFGLPQISRQYLRNDLDIAGVNQNAGDFQIFIPSLTRQNANDNNNKPFYKETGDTFVFNNEDRIKHAGKPTLMYYYGQSESNYKKIGSLDNDRFYYLPIGSTPSRTKIGFASPFVLLQGNELDTLNNYLDNPIAKSKNAAEASYLKGQFYNLGVSGETQINLPTISLTFGEDDTFHKTLWTEFHKKKYDTYFNSELLEATMIMTDVDWIEMVINRPIKYNDEIYQIISIENYDVVDGTAKIKLLKK